MRSISEEMVTKYNRAMFDDETGVDDHRLFKVYAKMWHELLHVRLGCGGRGSARGSGGGNRTPSGAAAADGSTGTGTVGSTIVDTMVVVNDAGDSARRDDDDGDGDHGGQWLGKRARDEVQGLLYAQVPFSIGFCVRYSCARKYLYSHTLTHSLAHSNPLVRSLCAFCSLSSVAASCACWVSWICPTMNSSGVRVMMTSVRAMAMALVEAVASNLTLLRQVC